MGKEPIVATVQYTEGGGSLLDALLRLLRTLAEADR